MSKYSIDSSTLTAIADAIREKGGTSDPILAEGMAAAIAEIQKGLTTPDGFKDFKIIEYIPAEDTKSLPPTILGYNQFDIKEKTRSILLLVAYVNSYGYIPTAVKDIYTGLDCYIRVGTITTQSITLNENGYTFPSNIQAGTKHLIVWMVRNV